MGRQVGRRVAHTEEEKIQGCSFQVESLVKSGLSRRAEGALFAPKKGFSVSPEKGSRMETQCL